MKTTATREQKIAATQKKKGHPWRTMFTYGRVSPEFKRRVRI